MRGIGARKLAHEGQKVERYRLWEKRQAGVFADLPQAKAAKSTTATTARKLPQEGGALPNPISESEVALLIQALQVASLVPAIATLGLTMLRLLYRASQDITIFALLTPSQPICRLRNVRTVAR